MDKLTEERHGLISSDEAAVSSGSESSVAGAVAGATGAGAAAGGGVGPRAPRAVPTISVTPHSPGILDEPLQHLQRIHQAVHRMRQQAFNPHVHVPQQFSRLSTSCPSLNKDDLIDPDGDGCPSPATPTHSHMLAHDYPGSRKGSVGDGRYWLSWRVEAEAHDMSRRRSWTALEDLSSRHKLTQDRSRQRSSMSLSSMESECDDVDNSASSGARGRRLLGSEPRGSSGGRRRTGRHTAAQSTHSLNEADLQKDFQKIVALREAESRLSPRLPLQKSISTPSIVALPHEAPSAPPLLTPSGALTESETEEEIAIIRGQVSVPEHGVPFALHDLLSGNAYDHHEEKRRKRGSLFFRKKKDKSKKASHQWVSACYGSTQICDWCSKPLTNKPALYCENCTTTVHQNSCKDNIVDCTKQKTAKSAINKSSSSISSKSVSKRGSLPGHAQNNTGSSGGPISNDDKEGLDHHRHEGSIVSDDAYSTGSEWSEAQLTASELGADPCLGLALEEPDSWSPSVSKELTKSLREKEIKRQEHIYEFIMTEKHHCLTLRVMQKMFADGLQRHFRLGTGVERMFPRLNELWQLHASFLGKLRVRQRERPTVATIADILLDQFSGSNAERLKSAYGEFCSRHRDAVEMYKDCAAREPRLPQFVRRCQQNPLLRKKGVPECVLFVAQRLTKYPLLIEPLIKAARDDKPEQEKLHKALALVKEILVSVDGQVAEKEKEDRKLEIYNRIDAKSYTVHREMKFKKSDILQGNRSLRFEGVATLMQGRSKMQMVLVIVLSDCLFFLQDNNNKYTFFTPDNKTGIVSLQKLLVREKAGAESRGIYLISSNPTDPEMFELKVHKPKDKAQWIQAIRSAVQNCPEEEDKNSINLSAEDRQLILEEKQRNIQLITRLLRKKDVEYAILLEEKMGLQLRLLAATGLNPPVPNPDYTRLVGEHTDTDTHSVWNEVCQAIKEVSMLASSLYASGTNLSRSISSAGERQSSAYVSPTLPRRAETFGGFDNQHGKTNNVKKQDHPDGAPIAELSTHEEKPDEINFHQFPPIFDEEFRLHLQRGELPWPPAMFPLEPPQPSHGAAPPEGISDMPPLLTLGREQQVAAVRLSHYVYTLMCIIWQQLTTIHSLEAQLSACKLSGEPNKPVYKHNQQLEELRNLQDKFSAEKAAWTASKEQEARALYEKGEQLARLQRSLQEQQEDVSQQRESLFRWIETAAAKGGQHLDVSDKVGAPDETLNTGSAVSSPISESSPTDTHKRKDSKWKSQASSTTSKQTLPLNLISAQNQQKIVTAQNLPIKQQLPLKLASLASRGGGNPMGLNNNMSNTGHSNISHSVVHGNQLLPLRLSQGSSVSGQLITNDRRYSGSGNVVAQGYQRLVDNDQSPVTSHSRTGSSPAMMGFGSTLPPSSPQNASNKATRTNTYPKLPERFRVRSPDSLVNPQTFSTVGHGAVEKPQGSNQATHQKIDDNSQSANQKEEEIIFF